MRTPFLFVFLPLIFSGCAVVASECQVTGCSGEICAAKDARLSSMCMWQESYQCYAAHGKCEVQPDGKCGWTQTQALEACLNQYRNKENYDRRNY